jgi:hypothetical protein
MPGAWVFTQHTMASVAILVKMLFHYHIIPYMVLKMAKEFSRNLTLVEVLL